MFHVLVYKNPPSTTDGSDSDDAANLVLSEPMGSDGLFGEGWDVPSKEFGLEMLSQVYDHGLEVSSADLDRLTAELDTIDEYWTATGFADIYFDDPASATRLRQTIKALRGAIERARAIGGWLVLT